jgi:hypothetical protein
MTSDLPRVSLRDEEREEAPPEDDADYYADHDSVPPTLSPYVLMGYGPRIQLMILFVRTRRAIPISEIHGAVEGDGEEIGLELLNLWNLGIVREVETGLFAINNTNPIAQELRDLFQGIERESDDMDVEDYA